MVDEQRRQAEQVFQQVAELSPAEREAYLDGHCAQEPAVRQEVESLLAHLDDGGTVTSLDVDRRAEDDEPDLVGEWIGPYKLLQVIGEGGFGAVYMAEQEQPLRRRVALKVIKLGMDTKQVIARFEAERQALALMDHPNIAKVLDAGTTAEGRPYFVMELVNGVPITQYCDANHLSTRARLVLFALVCQAVQHAHQKGIIHRDIKPSNVLVTLHDGKPVPKVIDFGIAKATNQRLTELTLFTEFRQLVGTPAYMSPEQAEMSGLDVDTRTDIYSLGVLLYELLTSTTPFDSKVLRSMAHVELQRVIREEEPPRPSARVSTLREQLTAVAKARRVEPQLLSRLMHGDLDWIAMKAIEKDRTRRYETAAGLAADIERHLRYEPVLAGPPRATYKLHKFVQRHRVGVMAGSFAALALLAGLALATVGFLHASAERDAADAAAERARAISHFLQDMLASADPLQLRMLSALAPDQPVLPLTDSGFTRDVSVAEMVRRASAKIDTTFAGKPLLEATARAMVGTTLRGLGLYADATPQLERALEIRRELLGDEHPDTLRSALALGALLLDDGRGNEAEPLVRWACDGMYEVYGARHPKTLSCMAMLAAVHADQGDYDTAGSLFSRALRAQREVLGLEHRDTLMTMWAWSICHLSQWKLAEGEALARELHDIAARTLRPDDSLNILSKPLLGWWYLARHQYAPAEAVLRPGLEQCRRILGPEHPFTYTTMHGLARSLQGRELQAEKERLLRRALAGLRATRGRHHRHTISLTADFVRWSALRGNFREAEPLFRELLDDCAHSFGQDAPYTLDTMARFADFLERAGNLDQSIDLRRQRVDLMRGRGGWNSVVMLNELGDLAGALARAGRIGEARQVTEGLIERFRALAEGPNAPPLALNNYAWVLLICVPADLRDPRAALPLAERATEQTDGRWAAVLDTLALAHHQLGDNDRAVEIQTKSMELLDTGAGRDLTYGANLVRYLLHKGDTAAADRYVRQSIDMFRAALGEENPLLAVELNKGAVSLVDAGHYSMAEALLRDALALNHELLGSEHEQVALTLVNLARVLHLQDRYDEAASAYRSVLAMRRKLLGDKHLLVAETLDALGMSLHADGQSSSAVSVLREALDVYQRLDAEDIPAAVNVKRDLACVLTGLGRLDEAAPLAHAALAKHRMLFGEQHRNTALAMQTAGLLLTEQGTAAAAEPILRRCVAVFAVLHLGEHDKWHVARAEGTLGYCLLTLRRFNEAEPLLLRSYEVLSGARGGAVAETRTTLERIVALYEAWGKPDVAEHWRTKLALLPPCNTSDADRVAAGD